MRFLANQDRLRGLLNLVLVSLQVWREFGFRTLVRKISFKLGSPEEEKAYAQWITRYEPDQTELDRQKHRQEAFPYRPLISVIMPVYNPQPEVLQAAIESVRKQTYENWELCLADGAFSRTEIRELLQDYAARDPRVKPIFLERNYGISGKFQPSPVAGPGYVCGLSGP